MPSEFATKVMALLEPSLGAFMAKTLVLTACKRENVSIEEVSKIQAPKIADHICELMTLKVGPEPAKAIKEKILAI